MGDDTYQVLDHKFLNIGIWNINPSYAKKIGYFGL